MAEVFPKGMEVQLMMMMMTVPSTQKALATLPMVPNMSLVV